MKLQVKNGENFSDELIRKIEEEIASSVVLINNPKADRHEKIHDVRKSFKKLRAIFRLIKVEIGEKNYKNENYFFRDLGKEISPLRDQTAILEVLEKLQLQYAPQLGSNLFEVPIEGLKRNRKKVDNEFVKRNKLGYLKARLSDKQYGSSLFYSSIRSFDQLTTGLRKIYKKGQQGLRMSMTTRAPEQLHEWRKNVNYLRYQFDVLSNFWPAMGTWEKPLHELSDLLGFDHDLLNLNKQIAADMVEFKSVSVQALLIALIYHHRGQAQSQALALGQNLYQDSADTFVGKINTYWLRHHKVKSESG